MSLAPLMCAKRPVRPWGTKSRRKRYSLATILLCSWSRGWISDAKARNQSRCFSGSIMHLRRNLFEAWGRRAGSQSAGAGLALGGLGCCERLIVSLLRRCLVSSGRPGVLLVALFSTEEFDSIVRGDGDSMIENGGPGRAAPRQCRQQMEGCSCSFPPRQTGQTTTPHASHSKSWPQPTRTCDSWTRGA